MQHSSVLLHIRNGDHAKEVLELRLLYTLTAPFPIGEISQILLLFIGLKSDHRLPLAVTYSCLEDLIDVTLACKDANSKLVDVVTVADFDDEEHVGNSLVGILTLKTVQDIEGEVALADPF